ncbi:hypothetical protein [Aliivibrio fischeri]|uniref:hypothetical protein n=1 Tax=Aliivibrio fischeri TaxID=668 RepID=UPI0018F14FF2|nr:hypothetical protein [Aliivibrio fischeri]USR97823.1 hypothetical protein AVFI_15255 [Aliivibrio fischeri ATCC 7744 = JCM 18803 = DSM 507]GGK21394.1 hypothetical protein GCM10007987_01610 [Aliivibrio fischeri]
MKLLTSKDMKIFKVLIDDKNMNISEAIKIIMIEVYFLSYKDRAIIRRLNRIITSKNNKDFVIEMKRIKLINSLKS